MRTSKFGEWPHVCAVLQREFIGDDTVGVNVYQCTASLISAGVILTSANCVRDIESLRNNLVVRCGEWDTKITTEPLPHQEQEVADIIIHPNFTTSNLHYNYALLFMERDFVLDDHISPVCLPSHNDMFSPQDCVSNGWGKDVFGSEGRYQEILKHIEVPLVEHNECQEKLQRTRLGQFFILDRSFLCAGGEKGIDTCRGDGGGPLTCRHREEGPWVQAGIVSWGIGCGEHDVPGVYADVSRAVCWIDRTVGCYFRASSSYFGFQDGDCPGESGNCPVLDQRGAELGDEVFVSLL